MPNQCLTDFWSHMAKKFTKFINLSESVEGTLLAIRGRANHAWPEAVRRARLNENYLEFTSEPVSYTHLDVYKRQGGTNSVGDRYEFRKTGACGRPNGNER